MNPMVSGRSLAFHHELWFVPFAQQQPVEPADGTDATFDRDAADALVALQHGHGLAASLTSLSPGLRSCLQAYNRAMTQGKAGSIARAMNVIRLCARRPRGASFNELRAVCDDAVPSTMARLLKTLQEVELISKDGDHGRYLIGRAMQLMAREVLGLAERAESLRPLVEQLAHESEESVLYIGCDGDQVERLIKQEQADSLHYGELGERLSILEHGLGPVCLAYYPEEQRRRILAMHDGDLAALEVAMAGCRRDGVMLRREAHRRYKQGVIRIGAPVFADGQVLGAIGIMFFGGEGEDGERERLINLVREAGERASSLL